MKKTISLGLSIIILIQLLLPLAGCSGASTKKVQAADLMTGYKAQKNDTEYSFSNEGNLRMTDFAVRLFQQSLEADKNTSLSPISVLYALGMTANGAKSDTLVQMEEVFGLSVNDINDYLRAYTETLSNTEKCKLNIANSIWFKDEGVFTADGNFLQKNADYYGAGAFKAPFDDTTLQDINIWVEEHTDGMIKNILDQIPEEAVMYLVNALSFDAEWQNIYYENQVHESSFTTEKGTESKVDFMYSDENTYLSDKDASGFIKYYAGDKDKDGNIHSKYAFAALLPKEDVSIKDYVGTLTGEKIQNILQNKQSVRVETSIPKFTSEYSCEMSDILKSMGMPDAFDERRADFSGLGKCSDNANIFINRVLHKTFIAVDERGTKAGAATVVEMVKETAFVADEPLRVYLDRPFVYMLIDCETNVPVFIGTVMDMGGSSSKTETEVSDLMTGIEGQGINEDYTVNEADNAKLIDFSIRMFKQSFTTDINTLVSPISVLHALGMTANGAEGATLAQMEEVIGVPVETINQFVSVYSESIKNNSKCKLNIADSIWFTDNENFTVSEDFLQKNADYYQAGAFMVPFNESTMKDINKWVSDNTDGMIDNIGDDMSEEDVMCLINALCFDAEWSDMYYDSDVRDGEFTAYDGTKRNIPLMYSGEHQYIQDEDAAGILKYYAYSGNGKKTPLYAFAALLPNEGVDIEEYVAALSGEKIQNILKNAQDRNVHTIIPKFESEYSVSMKGVLESMGMTDAFNRAKADFSGLGECSAGSNFYISSLLHKTVISVDQRGTKAGAVAAVTMAPTACEETDPKYVYLNRPFIYMLIDRNTNLPLFIGAVMDIN